MEQTAVEYLYEALWEAGKDKFMWQIILQQAKEMEKEQTVNFANDFYDDCVTEGGSLNQSAEEYYKQTYKQ